VAGADFRGGYLHDVIWGVAHARQEAKFGRRALHIIPDHRPNFYVLPRMCPWSIPLAKMGHFQASSGCFRLQIWQAIPPLPRGWLLGFCNQHHRAHQASQVHNFLRLGLVRALIPCQNAPRMPQLLSPTCAAYMMATGPAGDGARLVQPSV
jgi:hypothetical protein